MNIRTFTDEGLGNSTYLVEIGDRRALALDPPRDLSALRKAAADAGLSIAYAVETHLHADFISGSRELSAVGLLERGGREAAVFEGSPRDWATSAGEPLERAG